MLSSHYIILCWQQPRKTATVGSTQTESGHYRQPSRRDRYKPASEYCAGAFSCIGVVNSMILWKKSIFHIAWSFLHFSHITIFTNLKFWRVHCVSASSICLILFFSECWRVGVQENYSMVAQCNFFTSCRKFNKNCVAKLLVHILIMITLATM